MANGIPPLLNQIANVTNKVSLLFSDFNLLFNPTFFAWGIYFAGTNNPAIIPSNVISFDYKKEYKISDYPVELGSFANYNKVDLPYITQIRMSMGGTATDRANFLGSLAELATSVELFDVVTPEYVYLNANIIDYDYSRTIQSGAGMIVADIRLMEIRTTATTTFNNTQSPSDAGVVNGGQLSPSAPVTPPETFGS